MHGYSFINDHVRTHVLSPCLPAAHAGRRMGGLLSSRRGLRSVVHLAIQGSCGLEDFTY